MTRRILAGLAAATLAAVALPATAGPAPIGRIDSIDGHVAYGDLAPGAGEPRAVAARALRAYADRLGVDAGDFRFDFVRKSLIGTHVRGAEVRGGVPVAGTHALVTIADGRVIQVAAYDSDAAGGPVRTPVTEPLAISRALAAAGGTPLVPAVARRLLVDHGGTLIDTYRVNALTDQAGATYDIAAADGRLLAVRDENRYVDGEATVFRPNPLVTAKNSKLRQPGVDTVVDTDLPSDELDKQLVKMPMKGLDAEDLLAGKLTGPWADVYGPTLPASTTGKYAFKRYEPGFETTMAYAHIDGIQRYFQSIGFSSKRERGVNDEPQTLITLRVEGFDNSFYMGGGSDLIAFGTGGVDDAEDAEVIVHEYGHAVHDAQVPGWGDTHEGGAMGEGFGDFLAATFYARVSKGFGDTCVAEWDATSYSDKNPPCLRRTDSKKRYPNDMTNQNEKADSVHADGELWSAFLWRLRDRLGRTPSEKSANSLKLLLSSHELLTPQADFESAIAALRTAAKQLKQPKWAKHVDAAAKVTGMPYKG